MSETQVYIVDELKQKIQLLVEKLEHQKMTNTSLESQNTDLGNKLKEVARGDFESIDEAWEAHKIRNIIAHSGSDYILTQREAKRVIDLYTKVFTELKLI